MKQKEPVPAGSGWVEKNIRELAGSPVARIGDDWALLGAGSPGAWNAMTVSWGGLGVLWGKDAAFVFIRPSRYTLEFVNAESLFTLSFFDKSRRGALELYAAKSGRDIDKAAEAGLTPIIFGEGKAAGALGFREAAELVVCRKLYTHDFDPSRFLDPAIEKDCYPLKDYHRMFVGEVVTLVVRL